MPNSRNTKSLDSEAGDNYQLNWCPLYTIGMLVVITVRSVQGVASRYSGVVMTG